MIIFALILSPTSQADRIITTEPLYTPINLDIEFDRMQRMHESSMRRLQAEEDRRTEERRHQEILKELKKWTQQKNTL